jgi:hypothetical protein
LFIFLSSKKTIKVKASVHFRGGDGIRKTKAGSNAMDGAHTEVDALSMHQFDLRKFDLPKGTLKDKKNFLVATLNTIQNDKKMIEHCKNVCRKSKVNLLFLGEIREKRLKSRVGTSFDISSMQKQ